jgi:hypothetical protein
VFRIANSGGSTLNAFQREDNTTSMRVWSVAGSTTIVYNLAGISADAEWTLVYTRSGTTGKFFYKSGSSPIALTDSSGSFSGATVYGEFGGWASGEYFPSRQRAFARWTRALSDAEAQSMANTPQQILLAPYEARITWAEAQYQTAGVVTPTDYSSPMSRGIFRGIARGTA